MTSLPRIDITRRAVAFVAVVFTMTLIAAAQPERPLRPERPRTDAPRDVGPRWRTERPGFGEGRFLSRDQRARLREAFENQRERMEDLTQEIETARREFRTAAIEGMGERELRKRAAVVAQLEVERMMLQARALARLRDEVPPEARERIQQWRQRRGAAGLGPRAWGPRVGPGPFREGPLFRQPDRLRRGPLAAPEMEDERPAPRERDFLRPREGLREGGPRVPQVWRDQPLRDREDVRPEVRDREEKAVTEKKPRTPAEKPKARETDEDER